MDLHEDNNIPPQKGRTLSDLITELHCPMQQYISQNN